MKKNNMVKKKR